MLDTCVNCRKAIVREDRRAIIGYGYKDKNSVYILVHESCLNDYCRKIGSEISKFEIIEGSQ